MRAGQMRGHRSPETILFCFMGRHYNTARRIDFVLRRFPRLRKRIEDIGRKYYYIQENWDYDIDYNGERWLARQLAGHHKLSNVFDVGANGGEWAAMALEENPEARIHCFEICPPTFQRLASRFGGRKIPDKKIILNPFGLSDANSEVKVRYFPEGDAGSTLLEIETATTAAQRMEIINATVIRGKDYCARHGLASIDLLKLDVEGAEHLVLQGFDDLIHPKTIPVVQFEYGMANIITKFLLRDFYTFFQTRGYKVGKLFPNAVRFCAYRLSDENFLGPNYVAAAPEFVTWLQNKG